MKTNSLLSSLDSWAVCPSYHKNSLVLIKGVGCLNSHLTTFVHWLTKTGRSLWEWIQSANEGYIIVSDVGLIAIFSSKSELPYLVTQATSAWNPSMWFFSFSKFFYETNIGKYTFLTPNFLNLVSKLYWIYSQIK